MTSHEIINLHFGQAGIQFGNTCWELFCLEHDISPDGTHNKPDSDVNISDKFETMFMWGSKNSLIPRAVYCDLDPEILDKMIAKKPRKVIPHIFSGREDSASNFARGHYTVEDFVLDAAVCRVRKIAEAADVLEGFSVFHSVGGGTGSGFASHVMERIVKDFGNKTKISFSLYPGEQTSGSVVEPYNALLTTHAMMPNIDVAFLFNNDALSDICKKKLEIEFPGHKDLNQVMAQIVSSVTGTTRFDGGMNKLLREFPASFTPYPKLRYVVSSLSPMESATKTSKAASVNSMVTNCLDAGNQSVPWKPQEGEFISCSFLYRGKSNESGISKAINSVKRSKKVKFASRGGHNDVLLSMLEKPCEVNKGGALQKQSASMCMASNSTSLRSIWRNLHEKASTMMEKKAYIHWYVAEGMEELEFTEALDTLKTLQEEYKSLA